MGAVGVISHLHDPGFEDVRALARAAEAAGADWLGLPDAFWWRDSWLLLAEAAHATTRIEIGPLVTNPYLRHPFHTVAALASLQDLAGPRVFLGVGAGGSEVTGAAGVSRRDAAWRIRALIALVRDVASGAPLDQASGRTLEVPLAPLDTLVAGRGDSVLRAAGACADRALLWAIPMSDLTRSISLVKSTGNPELIWAPLVDHGGASRTRVRTIAAYSVLNSHASLHARWALSAGMLSELRRLLVAGGAAAAQELVPPAALDDLIFRDPSPHVLGDVAASAGATSIAIPAFSIDEVKERVAWARDVLAQAAV